MAGKRRKEPVVHVRWERNKRTGELRTDGQGRTYAMLRWTWNGIRDEESIGYCTAEEADSKARRKAAALLLGVRLENDSPTLWNVGAVVDEYLDDLELRLGEDHRYLKNETKRLVYVKDHLGTVAIDHVTPKKLQHYASARAREVTRTGTTTKRSSIEEEIQALRRAVKTVIDLGHDLPLTEPPAFPSLSHLPEDARPARRLLEPEVAKLIEAAGVDASPGLGTLVPMMAWSGRRLVAIFGVRRGDCLRLVDEELARKDRLLWYEKDKGGRERGWGPLTEPAFAAVVQRLDETRGRPDSEFLWRTATGLEWNDIRISKPFKRVVELAGLADVQPYDLRRFACTQILRQVVNPKVAIRFTGHRTVTTLMRYVYDEVGEAEEIAASVGWTPPEEAEAARRRRFRAIDGGSKR
jgi:integrase